MCLAILTTCIALLALGAVGPRLLIDPGVDRFRGDEREFVERVLMDEPALRDEPVPLVTARRVASVEGEPGAGGCGYSAEVELYTLFGIPYAEHTLDCGGSSMVWYLFTGHPQGFFDFAFIYGYGALVYLFLASPLVGPLLVLLLIAGGVSVHRKSDGAFGRVVGAAAIGEGVALAAGGVFLVLAYLFLWF